ncbi:hypothetical protein KPH14_011801 [Odynerus spinipes]|uniref:Uncharacterized protein n=1 Tax=Odynerus spinipes TaxID=1348599 RepID=A0AAD9VU15_9HYME|nr:hypothetical protein KPH14_011801 [Odynerus spinipes]
MVSVKRKNSIFKKTNVKKSRPCEKTRKQIRKEKRQEKKARKALSYQNRKQIPGRFVLNPDKLKESPMNSQENLSKLPQNTNKQKTKKKVNKQERKRNTKSQLISDNDNEDKMIKQLEKRLKLNKRKSNTIPKSFIEDGLDYLLDFCNNENRKHIVDIEEQLVKGEADKDLEEDIAMLLETDKSISHNTEDWNKSEEHAVHKDLKEHKLKNKKKQEIRDSLDDDGII